MWGRQSCLRPAFRPAGPAGKRVRRLKACPTKVACALLFTVLLPPTAGAEVVCALGPASSYNAYQDERPSHDAMQLAGEVNGALTPICRPQCPEIALFRNSTAPNAMLIAGDGQAKIVYAPQFFTAVFEAYGDTAIVALIAHELGHAVDETAPAAWIQRSWPPELRADAWAACALAKTHPTATALRGALAALAKYPSRTHPGWSTRLPALRTGFTQCGGDGSQFDGAAPSGKHN